MCPLTLTLRSFWSYSNFEVSQSYTFFVLHSQSNDLKKFLLKNWTRMVHFPAFNLIPRRNSNLEWEILNLIPSIFPPLDFPPFLIPIFHLINTHTFYYWKKFFLEFLSLILEKSKIKKKEDF